MSNILPNFIPSYQQYQNAPKLNELLNELEQVLIIPINLFYDRFFNIMTCDTQGLNNWGLILNRTRDYLIYNYDESFGFDTGEPNPTTTKYPQNFGHGSFWSASNRSEKAIMSDAQYRIVLLLLYQKYSVDCSVKACTDTANYFTQLTRNDPTLNCTVIDNYKTFTYHFNYSLTAFEQTILKLNQNLPKPAGIHYNVTWLS
jgi:hypothetical protein